MKRNALLALLLAAAAAAPVAADQLVLPLVAVNWPGRAGNRWSSELFLTNPGPATVNVTTGRFLPGTLAYTVRCEPPVAALFAVAPYSTMLVSADRLALDLQCPAAALGAMSFDADGPAMISSRIVNDRGASSDDLLAGVGQDVAAFGAADLAAPAAVYMLPGLVWDPFRCGPPAFEIYLYFANAGTGSVDVTLQQSRDGRPGELLVNGVDVPTPYAFTLDAGTFRQLKVELGGPMPANLVCQPPQLVDLFFSATGAVAAVASVVDRSSQDARTVVPIRTAE